MANLNEFYKSILNINNKDHTNEIVSIIKEELASLKENTGSLDSFCKYIAYNIFDRLKEKNISGFILDLKDLVDVDHVIIVTNTEPRLLIDPTYEQFVSSPNKILVGLDSWPGDKIDSKIKANLLQNGYIEIDNEKFKNYLNSFAKEKIEIDLEDYLLDYRLKNK